MAQSLFDEAKKLMAANDYAHACPKLAESQRLDPSGGTMLHLGICHEGEGKTASAYAELNEAISIARRDGRADREAAAKSHLEAITPKLIKLTILVGDEARTPDLVISYDGTNMNEPQWNTPFPVDPGDHVITATAPKKKAWTTKLHIEAGATPPAIAVPRLQPSDDSATPAPSTAPNTAPTTGETPQAESSGSSTRVLGLGLAGAGVVALAVAGVFELRSMSLADDRDAAAAAGDQPGRDQKHADARSSQLVAMIAGGAGLVALGAGAVLFFTSRSPKTSGMRVSPFVSAGSGGFVATGAF